MKPTIYEALKAKLGREPSHRELCDECERIIGRVKPVCRECGASVAYWSLKQGVCLGCRNPNLIVKAVTK